MKTWIKKIVRLAGLLVVAPPALLVRWSGSRDLFAGVAQVMSLVPGKTGSYLRMAFYRLTLRHCAEDGYIGFGSFFAHPEAEMGRSVYIGAHCIIGMAKIGDHATLGSGIHVLSGKHQHGFTEIGIPIQEQGGRFERVTIGENCWVGNGSIIMADLGIQNVVAAGSVVTRATADFQVIAGNPARTIRSIVKAPGETGEEGFPMYSSVPSEPGP